MKGVALLVKDKGKTLVKIGNHRIAENDLIKRIIDKIPAKQFHKIIVDIERNLDREVKRNKT